MDVKEAVAIAKQYVKDVFAGESIENVGLEEVEFEDGFDAWSVTIGFSRPWQRNLGSFIALELQPRRRDYRIVRISDRDKKVLSAVLHLT